MTSRIHSCYITSPAGSKLENLTQALRSRGIRVVVPQESQLGSDFAAEMSSLLSHVDLVIGVLTRERRSEWVLFELGQAWALDKRVLLFVPPSTKHLPSHLQRFLTVRANLSNRAAVEFALDQLLAAPEQIPSPPALASAKHVLGADSDDFLLRIRQLSQNLSRPESELERLVANALRAGSVEVMSTATDLKNADFAIWSDALQPYIGNPLLVEVKSRLPNARAASEAAHRLSKQVTASGSHWGLLLYGSDDAAFERVSLPPNVLAMSIEALLSGMRTQAFDDIVRDLRNRRVHGMPT